MIRRRNLDAYHHQPKKVYLLITCRVSIKTSFDSKKTETGTETRFGTIRTFFPVVLFYIETASFGISVKPKQSKTSRKQRVELGLLLPYFSKLPRELSVLQHCPWTCLFYRVCADRCVLHAASGHFCLTAAWAGLPLEVSVLHQPVLQPVCLAVSVLQQPVLPLDISVLQQPCAASGCVGAITYSSLCCHWTRLVYSSLCCLWTCLFYISLWCL
jgi:hypothetical protein